MPLIARVEEKELDGDDLLISYFVSGRVSGSSVERTLKVRARAEAGLPPIPDIGFLPIDPRRTTIETKDFERRGPFVKGTATVRVRRVK